MLPTQRPRRRARALLALAVTALLACVASAAPASAAQMKLLSRLDNGEVWTKTGQQGSDWVYQANNMVSAYLDGQDIQAVSSEGNLFEKPYGAQYWSHNGAISGVRAIRSGGGRLAAMMHDRRLMTREAPWVSTWAGNSWIFQNYGAIDAAVTGNRIAAVLDNGELWVKEGNQGDQWVFETNGAVDVELTGNRIVVLLNNGEIWMKEGSLHDVWQFVTSSAIAFDADGQRIAAVMWDKRLIVKDGPLSNPWMFYVNAATKVSISRDTVAAILDDRSLWVHKPETGWVFQNYGSVQAEVAIFEESSWQYGGADHSVNTDGEADAVWAAIRSTSEAGGSGIYNGLSAGDQATVRGYVDARWPSSRTYGGGNWRLDTTAEIDAFISAYRQSSDNDALNRYNWLTSDDRGQVDARIAATVVDSGLYRAPGTAPVWEYENGNKAWITSPQAADQYGFDLTYVVLASQGALDRLATSPDNITYDAPSPDDAGGSDALDDGLLEDATQSGPSIGSTYSCTKATTLRNAGGKYAIGWCFNNAKAKISGSNMFKNTKYNKYWKAFVTGNANKCAFLQTANTSSRGNLKPSSVDIARNCGRRGISTNVFASTFYKSGGETVNGVKEDNQDEFIKQGTACSRYRNVDFTTAGQTPHDKIDTLNPNQDKSNVKVQVRYKTKGGDYVMARYPASSAVRAGTSVDTTADWAFIRRDCLVKLPSQSNPASSAVGGM